jgi:hypothetical protein
VDRPDDSSVRFLSLASHELRGPLATVRSALLASPRFVLDAKVLASVQVMLRNIDRALASWELLAEAWRLDTDGLKLDLRDEDLLPSLRASAEMAASSSRERSVRLEVALPPNLPPVRVDLERIQLALAGRGRTSSSAVGREQSPGSLLGQRRAGASSPSGTRGPRSRPKQRRTPSIGGGRRCAGTSSARRSRWHSGERWCKPMAAGPRWEA